MKKCHRCGTPWNGYGANPRAREVCAGCGISLHCCINCHHFNRRASACDLKESSFIGSRTVLNYCDYFRMIDSTLKAREAKLSQARSRWDALFGP